MYHVSTENRTASRKQGFELRQDYFFTSKKKALDAIFRVVERKNNNFCSLEEIRKEIDRKADFAVTSFFNKEGDSVVITLHKVIKNQAVITI